MANGSSVRIGLGLAAGALVLAGSLAASDARADGYCQGHPNPVTTTAGGGGTVQVLSACPQATIGTALLGAELVIDIEYFAGVHNRWVLIGSGLGGLAAGAVGGVFIDMALDTAASNGSPSMGLVGSGILAVGLGLVIPTAIAYASATSYVPDTAPRNSEDNTPNVPLEESTGQPAAAPAPAATPATGGTARHRVRQPASVAAPVVGSLVMVHDGHVDMGVPALGIATRFSTDDLRHYGQAPGTEWRIPVLSGSF